MGKALLEPCLLRAEHADVGLSRVEAVLRAQVGVSRFPVEERDQQQAGEREQPGRSETDHKRRFLRRAAITYLRTATMHAISAVTSTSTDSSRGSSRSASRVESPSTGRPGVTA